MGNNRTPFRTRIFFILTAVFFLSSMAESQDLFEIQVYPYETVEPGHTMTEFHLNYVPGITSSPLESAYEGTGQFHFTVEITQGLTPTWELGTYIVSAVVADAGWQVVGWRLRPRFRLAESLGLPFRFSVSTELGFTRAEFDPNTVTLEIRPIIEKEFGKLYLSVNPDFTKSFRGADASEGFGMEPGIKVSYATTPVVNLGVEYYAETGPISHFSPWEEQHHMIFPTLDLNVSPLWELNFGVGRGLTSASHDWIVKAIVGHLFEF